VILRGNRLVLPGAVASEEVKERDEKSAQRW